MDSTSLPPNSDDGFGPKKFSRSMSDAFLELGAPLHMQEPRLGVLKHSKTIKLCGGKIFKFEIRETERAVLIYLFGRSGGVVDDLLVRQAMQALLLPYDRDSRPQYTIGNQFGYIMRATEVDGCVVATRMAIDEAIAEIHGEPRAAAARREHGPEAKPDADVPKMSFMIMRHDAWCPGVHGDGDRCICNPVPEIVDREAWIRSYTETGKRAAKRAAAANAKKGQP
jgi:hypothetical protein